MEFSMHIDQQHKPFKEALSALIQIPSVLVEGEGVPPFGKPIDDAESAKASSASIPVTTMRWAAAVTGFAM